MIESLMLMALGFLVATLFALAAAQFVWRRAVKVTTRRLEGGEGAADDTARMAELDTLLKQRERESAPLQAEVERLRAQNRELATANDDLARENGELIEKAKVLRTDIEARTSRAAAAGKELTALQRAIADEARRHGEALTQFGSSAARLGGTLGPAPAKAPETVAVQPLEPYPAAEGESEADTDARTLAEVKASLLAELEDGDAAAQAPEAPETAEKAEESRPPALPDSHAGERTLAARIRALEAGVQ
ncbi:MAG: hypothetical protein RH982_09290 [Parvibaculum sp.]